MSEIGPAPAIARAPPPPARRGGLQRFLGRPAVETALGGLIITSVALTVMETTTTSPSPLVVYGVHFISAIFVLELFLRLRVAPSRKSFFREYWLDILSVLPLLAALDLPFIAGASATPPQWLAALALLRIFRLFRLLKIARHRVLMFPRVLRKGAREVFFASGLVMLAIVFASSALVMFERESNPTMRTFPQAFWFSVYSVVAAEPIPGPPQTLGGHVVAVLVILTGLFTFATVVGTISALVSDRIRSGDLIVEWEDLKEHLVVCGFSRKAEIIVREYIAAYPDDDRPIVIVAELEGGVPQLRDPTSRTRVQFLNDDFTKLEALEKAGIRRAARCIILSDTSKGRKERDADARTVLAALTIERLNPRIYTVAEIHRREHAHHLEMGKVNDYVVSGEQSAFLLAQSAITRGVMSVFSSLLTREHGNRFSRCSVTHKWKGKSFLDLMVHMKKEHNALLVGVAEEERIMVNPTEYVFQGDEDVVLIAAGDVKL
ncbi:MAG: ion transporter [Labilithrix sp.]|nr:ion transporter [Labilithrix sp.]